MAGDGVPEFSDLVSGTADLDEVLAHGDLLPDHTHGQAGDGIQVFAFFGFAGGATSEVGLMFAALGVCEI